jgi:2-methylisocitrate lyase-like PEP mutase family enzyme
MQKSFTYFNFLHESNEPLLIANVWNAQSARVFEKLNYKALATSSAAVAESLGYPDGQQMSFEEYLFVVKSIVRSVQLPLSVDLEAGYGDTPKQISENINRLVSAGVVGINIEDSIIQNGKRSLVDAKWFADRLRAIMTEIKTSRTEIFINVRCDAFLLGVPSPVQEAISRLKLYEATGVHGLFFPCIKEHADIQAVVQATRLPINVMCFPGLPDFAQLKQAGVKRISMGNFVNHQVYHELERIGKLILEDGSFKSVTG